MIGYIILIILLIIIIFYIIYLNLPKKSSQFYSNKFKKAICDITEKLAKEKEEIIKVQSEAIQQEIHDMELVLEEKAKNYKEKQNELIEQFETLKTSIEKQKEDITKSLQKHITEQQEIMNENLLKEQRRIEDEVCKLDDKYQLTIIEYENKMFEAKCKFEDEEKFLNDKIEERKKEINILIEQFKKDEEARKQSDFYRIVISPAAKNDVEKLKGMAVQLNNPSTLYKLIWKEYYQTGFNQMIGRVLGNNAEKSGIYKITNIKNQMCYVGQAANIKNRWSTHCKRALKADDGAATNRLYQYMWEDGLENFTFQVVEFCSKDKLTEREKFYIDFFNSKEWGFNSKT